MQLHCKLNLYSKQEHNVDARQVKYSYSKKEYNAGESMLQEGLYAV